jgi:hypothetical protein
MMIDRRSLMRVLGGLSAAIAGWFGSRIPVADADSPGSMMGGGMMGGGMMDDHSMRGMMGHGNMTGPMRLGMELFQRHTEIKRATDYLPNGIIDTTISSDATTAGIIKAHVVEMYDRLAENRPFPYPISPSVTTMFAHSAAYHRSYRLLPDGIEVTETSDDPDMVKVIYAHARELDRFAKDGMPAMMRGMMGRKM